MEGRGGKRRQTAPPARVPWCVTCSGRRRHAGCCLPAPRLPSLDQKDVDSGAHGSMFRWVAGLRAAASSTQLGASSDAPRRRRRANSCSAGAGVAATARRAEAAAATAALAPAAAPSAAASIGSGSGGAAGA